MTPPFTLAACAEMLWPDKPMDWRLKRLTEMGFQCGIWNWGNHDLGMLERSGAVFSSMTGYVRGRLADDDGAEELLATAKQSIEVGKRLNVARLNLHGTGLGDRGLPVTPCETVTGAMWLKAQDTLSRIADLAEQHGVTFMIENLNLPVDHPGVPFARIEDTLALVSAVNHPRLQAQPRPLSCADRRGEPDRVVPQVPALHRRDPGGRRAGPQGAGHRRDQLSRRRTRAQGHGLSRPGLHGSLRLRRCGGCARRLPHTPSPSDREQTWCTGTRVPPLPTCAR